MLANTGTSAKKRTTRAMCRWVVLKKYFYTTYPDLTTLAYYSFTKSPEFNHIRDSELKAPNYALRKSRSGGFMFKNPLPALCLLFYRFLKVLTGNQNNLTTLKLEYELPKSRLPHGALLRHHTRGNKIRHSKRPRINHRIYYQGLDQI